MGCYRFISLSGVDVRSVTVHSDVERVCGLANTL